MVEGAGGTASLLPELVWRAVRAGLWQGLGLLLSVALMRRLVRSPSLCGLCTSGL